MNIENVGEVPITSSKEAQAKVSVRDHDTVILGGLIDTEKDKSKSGVPFLMDIPLLGHLFRSSTTRTDAQRTDRADSADGAADAGDRGADGGGGEAQDARGAEPGEGVSRR